MAKLSKAARARRRVAEREWGDQRSLGLSVYQNKRGAFDSEAALKSALKTAQRAFPGSKIKIAKPYKRGGKRWRGSIVFAYPISREILAAKIGAVKWNAIEKRNGRLHLLTESKSRKVEPLSAAHANPIEAATEAQDQLLTNYFQYPRDDDEPEEVDVVRAVAKIDRKRSSAARKQKRDARGRFV